MPDTFWIATFLIGIFLIMCGFVIGAVGIGKAG